MRYLGIDYGAKRVGLALSDEEGRIAIPFKTLENSKNLVAVIKKIVIKEDVGKVVLGLPIPFSGGESKQTLETKKFAELAKKEIELPIEFENEVLTTKLAQKSGIPREHLDKASATIILQSYLDKMSH